MVLSVDVIWKPGCGLYTKNDTHTQILRDPVYEHIFPFLFNFSNDSFVNSILNTFSHGVCLFKGCCPWAWFCWKVKIAWVEGEICLSHSLGGQIYDQAGLKNESRHWKNGTFCNTPINLLWTFEYFYVQQLRLKIGLIAQSRKWCSIMISFNWCRMYLIHLLSPTRAVETRDTWCSTLEYMWFFCLQRISIVTLNFWWNIITKSCILYKIAFNLYILKSFWHMNCIEYFDKSSPVWNSSML